MKRLMVGLCAMLVLLPMLIFAVEAKVFDDTDGHWAEAEIDEWSEYGIINGVSEKMFLPDKKMTRAEMASLLSNLLNLQEAGDIGTYTDTNTDAWYADVLGKCVEAGIIIGDGKKLYPDNYVTREMFCTVVCRILHISEEDSINVSFADEGEISDWAAGYVYALVNAGYFKGVGNGMLDPGGDIDRASVIALLDRIVDKYYPAGDGKIEMPSCNTVIFNGKSGTVVDGFFGTVIVTNSGAEISFSGATVNVRVIVGACDVELSKVPSGVEVITLKNAANVYVNGKETAPDTTVTAKPASGKDNSNGNSGVIIISPHKHSYNGAVTKAPACDEKGTKTYTCKCGDFYEEDIPPLTADGIHTPAQAVKENETAGNCQTKATYDEVVYCSLCNHEISRTNKEGDFGEHTPATAVKENETSGNCQTKATYDEVVYCSLCNHEISRTAKQGDFGEHTPAAEVKENETTGNCQTKVTYDEVVYCSICTTELSREAKQGDFGEHTPAAAVKENETTGNCQTKAIYDEVVYCSICNHEISREEKQGDFGEHTPATAVKENETAGNCQTKATYDEVVYCSICTTELDRQNKQGDFGEHTPATAVKENETTGNCQTKATYDEVVYCSICTTELSREAKQGNFGAHVPAAEVRENETTGNCQTKATYDEVVYCSICTTELSRTNKEGNFGEHTPAAAVKENETAGNCQTKSTYDEVVYCSLCNHEISRTAKQGDFGAHTPAAAVKENETAGNCQTKATYDEVVYCSICTTELSREAKHGDFGEHTPAAAVKENETAGNCQTKATYDEVVYCSLCNHEISRTAKQGDFGAHVPAQAVKENETVGNCQTKATYDEVVYCSLCNHEISREAKQGNFGEHTPAAAVKENETTGNCQTKATYDEVVYCSLCNHEISRTNKEGGFGAHTPAQAVRENETAGNCQTKATYDEVVYCSICTTELSRTAKQGDFGEHSYQSGSCVYCSQPDRTTYTVTFKDWDGDVLKVQTDITYGSAATAPTDPIRNEYEFIGWDKAFDNITEDIVVTALYTPVYSGYSQGLEYASEGDGTCYVVSIGDCTDTDIVIPVTSPDGDTVIGIDSSAFAGEAITSVTIPNTVEEISRRAFNNCTLLTDVYYDGSETEWNNIAIGSNNDPLLDANIHFSKVVKYTVTFKDYNGAILKTEEVESGKSATAPTVPERVGYTFDGWDISYENVTADITVTATYLFASTESTLVVSSVETTAGAESVVVLVNIHNNPGIPAMEFKVNYDESAMTLVSAENGDAMNISGMNFTPPNGALASGSTFTWFTTEVKAADIKDGSVMKLTFNIASTAEAGNYPISISYTSGNIVDNNITPVDMELIEGAVVIK